MNDLKIHIATGKSHLTSTWKNEQWEWEDLVVRLSQCKRSKETLEQYTNADKQSKATTKSRAGAFVGGYLIRGKRNPASVRFRSLITLDIDDVKGEDFLEALESLDNYEYVLHSTHSHTEEFPRYRLIMPLDRESLPAEYIAVARRLAEYINIELFDESGYQPFRLMYWPSCSKDAEPVFIHNTGQHVPVDDLLETYVDWTDVTSWPSSRGFAERLNTGMERQADPHGKPGAIGVFCRTYTIPEVIDKYLSDVYEPSQRDDDRYTYIHGGTANGVIIYDDGKFAFSHHGTDPVSGKLVNAYDLVRIHLFADKDTDGNSMKRSMEAMSELVYDDPRVKMAASKEQIARVKNLFGDMELPEEPKKESKKSSKKTKTKKKKRRVQPGDQMDYEEPYDDEEPDEDDEIAWMANLERAKNGNILSSALNLKMIFENDPLLSDTMKRNEFDTYSYVFPGLPWRDVVTPERWRDVDFSGLRAYVEIVYGISAAGKIEDALKLNLELNTYHPVRDYLEACIDGWDGEERIATLLTDYQGVEQTIYSAEAMRVWMTAAVARIYEPGKKFDMVLTLQGGQGSGKSTFFKALGGDYFSDTFTTFDGTRAFEQLQGVWIVEMAELSGMSKSTVDQVKAFVSSQWDQYRKAYGRTVDKHPRQCVFGASTNEDEFLRDATGNRRFLPVVVNPDVSEFDAFDLEADPEYVMQLWGEAVDGYFAGNKLYLTGDAAKTHAQAQRRHQIVDSRLGLVEDYLEMKVPAKWYQMDTADRKFYFNEYDSSLVEELDIKPRRRVSAIEVWTEALGEPREKFKATMTREVNNLLSAVPGWHKSGKSRTVRPYGKQRYYERRK